VATKEEAVAAVRRRTGLGEGDAKQLVNAVVAAAQDEALDVIAGQEPVPSALADARALRLRRIAKTLGRSLRQREVEAVFRLDPTGASRVIGKMVATYPAVAEDLLGAEVADVLADPRNRSREGSAGAGWRYVISFDERTQVDHAAALFARHGLARHVLRVTGRSLEVDAEIGKQDAIELLQSWLR
jgi:hypothetical protein